MRFSVIMPVCLEGYVAGPNRSASNPEFKFTRAIDSFLNQTFQDAELIIIADGSKRAEEIYLAYYSQYPNIKFKYIEKTPLFSGLVRQAGIDMAEGEIVCYLDHDDVFGVSHLAIINQYFDTSLWDWVYYNDFLVTNPELTGLAERDNIIADSRIGTSTIAHKRSLGVKWPDGYGHDWRLIESCLLPHPCAKIPTAQYYVCHSSGFSDF
jgi:glycosyltransferase involved in cell wall biosynthesis